MREPKNEMLGTMVHPYAVVRQIVKNSFSLIVNECISGGLT